MTELRTGRELEISLFRCRMSFNPPVFNSVLIRPFSVLSVARLSLIVSPEIPAKVGGNGLLAEGVKSRL